MSWLGIDPVTIKGIVVERLPPRFLDQGDRLRRLLVVDWAQNKEGVRHLQASQANGVRTSACLYGAGRTNP
jgi:hypothetical protein